MVIVDGPQCADLGVLQHPGVEYYEQSHLLVQGLALENDLLGDKNTRITTVNPTPGGVGYGEREAELE